MSFDLFLAFPFCLPCDGFDHQSFIKFSIIELFKSNNLLFNQCPFSFENLWCSQIGHHLIKYLTKFGYKPDMKGFFNKKKSFYIPNYMLESIKKSGNMKSFYFLKRMVWILAIFFYDFFSFLGYSLKSDFFTLKNGKVSNIYIYICIYI